MYDIQAAFEAMTSAVESERGRSGRKVALEAGGFGIDYSQARVLEVEATHNQIPEAVLQIELGDYARQLGFTGITFTQTTGTRYTTDGTKRHTANWKLVATKS